MSAVKPLVILIALLVGCTHPAPMADYGEPVDRTAIVLTGELSRDGELKLKSATGRVYAVRAQGSRFAVSVPAGVYDVTSIDGVRPAVPLSFNGIPGDRLDLGRFDVERGTVAPRSGSTGTSAGSTGTSAGSAGTSAVVTRRAGYFGGMSRESPLHYYARTGERTRPLPVPAGWGGGSRAGMGLGFRSR